MPQASAPLDGDASESTLLAALRRMPARYPWLAWVALVAGIAASVGAGLLTQAAVENEARSAFTKIAHDVADQFEGRIRAYSEVVYSVRALIDSSDEVTRTEFHRFAQGLAIGQRYPGITNISQSFRVRNDARTAFEQKMRTGGADLLAGLPPFKITPAGERPEYVALSYIEPLKDNAEALGLDLLTDPVREDAVRRARDSGALSTTSGMTLLRDANTRAISVLLRLAVYDGGSVPPTVEARRQAFSGVAGVAIRLPEMLESALTVEARLQLRLRARGHHGGHGARQREGDRDAPVRQRRRGVIASRRIHAIRSHEPFQCRRQDLGNPHHAACRSNAEGRKLAASLRRRCDRRDDSAPVFGLLRSLAAAETRGLSLRRNLRTLEFHRARLAETQEIAHIGGFEWDIRKDVQIWTDQMYKLLGRAVGDPPEPDRDFFYANIVHHADALRVREAVRRVLEAREPVALQCRIVRADGTERMMSTVTRLEASDDGTRTRVVGTVRDITDEWQAAERERAQLRFIQTMMDAIPIPVYQKDRDGRFQACNDAWCRFLGKPRELLIGRSPEEVLPGPMLDAIRAQDRRLLDHVGTDSIDVALPNAAGELGS